MRLRAYEKMGIHVVVIYHPMWNQLLYDEKIRFLQSEVRLKVEQLNSILQWGECWDCTFSAQIITSNVDRKDEFCVLINFVVLWKFAGRFPVQKGLRRGRHRLGFTINSLVEFCRFCCNKLSSLLVRLTWKFVCKCHVFTYTSEPYNILRKTNWTESISIQTLRCTENSAEFRIIALSDVVQLWLCYLHLISWSLSLHENNVLSKRFCSTFVFVYIFTEQCSPTNFLNLQNVS